MHLGPIGLQSRGSAVGGDSTAPAFEDTFVLPPSSREVEVLGIRAFLLQLRKETLGGLLS